MTAVEWFVEKIKIKYDIDFYHIKKEINQSKEMEKRQKDDYAIEFAEWYGVKCILSSLDYHLTTKELLEIFKKEKGL